MRKSALAAALATLVLAPFAASAGQKVHEKTKIVGNTAVASWDYTEGNIITFISIVVTDQDISGTGGKQSDAFVSVAIDRADLETGNVLLSGRAEAVGDNFTFNIDRQLNVATLSFTNAIFQDDNSFTFSTLDANLSWTATGEPEVMKSNDKIKEPGMTVHSRFQGTFREAQATGTLLGKNIPAFGGANVEWVGSRLSSSAQLQFNKFGQQTITTTTP